MKLINYIVLFSLISVGNSLPPVCTRADSLLHAQWAGSKCHKLQMVDVKRLIYIFYDVNRVEGFNLRRDVYIRWAVFINHLRQKPGFKDLRLVLPPFPKLYHWKSRHWQQDLQWKQFFDLTSMKKFVPVLDYSEFLEEAEVFATPRAWREKEIKIDRTFKLKPFEDMFENGVFIDKFEYSKCKENEHFQEDLLEQPMLEVEKITCLKFQGSASMLEKVLKKELKAINTPWPKIFVFLNGETALHDSWGNEEFWRARRSMRFNQRLHDIADSFIFHKFDSTEESQNVQRPLDWRDEKENREAVGGDYICAHLRRGDFLYGREKTLPTLKSAATQIADALKAQNVSKVFIASDCNPFEYKNLNAYMPRSKKFRYQPADLEERYEIKDGGIAIIDQIICSRAKYFIGTYESTFTYRIYEEREILGFTKESTFNTFCRNADQTDCVKNAVWPIFY